MTDRIKYSIIKLGDTISFCATCGAMPVPVPYGGHPLSRIWNRVNIGEILICCPNGCKDGETVRPRKICRGEVVLINEGQEEDSDE
jgi:hypothetical protein